MQIGAFVLERRLGRGGMAEVFAERLAALDHPCIVTVLDAGALPEPLENDEARFAAGPPYFVMERATRSLDATSAPLSWPEAVEVAHAVLAPDVRIFPQIARATRHENRGGAARSSGRSPCRTYSHSTSRPSLCRRPRPSSAP